MPQIQLPFFPEGVTHITPLLAFCVEDGRVTYFNGNMPVFIHGKDDIAAFMMITAQFCVNGNRENGVFVVYWIPIGGCSVFGSDIAWTTCKDYFALKRGGAFPKRPVCRQECALFPQHSPNHSV